AWLFAAGAGRDGGRTGGDLSRTARVDARRAARHGRRDWRDGVAPHVGGLLAGSTVLQAALVLGAAAATDRTVLPGSHAALRGGPLARPRRHVEGPRAVRNIRVGQTIAFCGLSHLAKPQLLDRAEKPGGAGASACQPQARSGVGSESACPTF